MYVLFPLRVSVPVPAFVSPPEPLITALIVRSEVAAVELPIVKVLVVAPRLRLPLMLAPLALFVAEKVTFPPRVRVPLPVVTAAVVPDEPPPRESVVMDWLIPFRSSVPLNMFVAAVDILPDPLSRNVPAFEEFENPRFVDPL